MQNGAPVFSRDLELIGVTFDDVGEARCIAMAAPGVLTVLRDIFGAEELLNELEFQERKGASE